MKKNNILLIGGGLLLIYLLINKRKSILPVNETTNLPDVDKIQPVLISPIEQVTEQINNKIDNSSYRVKYIAGSTHYI